jgi:tRNA A-37 threonylcarbamoyl transferase component Bud32
MADSVDTGMPPKDAPTSSPAPPSPGGPGPAAPPAANGPSSTGASGSPAASPTRTDAAAKSGTRDARGLSALDEANLERSVIRRGLATEPELEACKKLRAKNAEKGLLEIMVAAGVLTKNQALRLVREVGEVAPAKLEIPGYQIIEKLGKGSMGVVYKARQTSVDRVVALKVLLDALARNREFIGRFQREAKIAAKLSHNNIVNAIDAGTVGNYHYFVMEYVEGRTIKDMLDAGKIFDERDALEIVLRIADALKHAHQRGLIHRDIKPENIILTKDGNVKLADLGLARPTADEKWAMAEAGMAIGTPYYISPEQVRGQVDVDIRADIYGLGATLYHMTTGRVPYPGDSPTDVMKKHADKAVALIPPDHVNDKLSSGLGEVVETMMAKDREDRYQTPDDLILDLKCLLAGERPMIAAQKAEDLASLAEGEETEDAGHGALATEDEKAEMAAVANSRMTVIVILAFLLAVSAASNALVLLKLMSG